MRPASSPARRITTASNRAAEQLGDRPDAHAAARRRVAHPPRRGVVLEPAAGVLQRLRLPRRADRPRRRPASRRLPLRVREHAVRRRHQVRAHPGAEQGDGGAAGLPRAARAVQGRSGFAGDPQAASLHRASGTITSLPTTPGAAARRTTTTTDEGEGAWSARRAAALQAYFEWMPIREDAQTLDGEHLSRVPLWRPWRRW